MDETGRLIEAGAHPRPPPKAPAAAAPTGRATRPARGYPARPPDPLRRMGTKDLVTEVARKASTLARKEVELAKAELKTDLRNEVKMAGGLGAAGLFAIWGVELLLVAIVLALMESGVLPGWAAALIVAAVVFAIGAGIGLWGWSRRVKKPLDTTRRSLEEDVRWAKERLA
jgi:uncharacterized membrane protein YqjE